MRETAGLREGLGVAGVEVVVDVGFEDGETDVCWVEEGGFGGVVV